MKSSRSIGIGDGNVFEESSEEEEDSEEEKDKVLDLEPEPEPVKFIEEKKVGKRYFINKILDKKMTRNEKNQFLEISINAKLMSLFEVIGKVDRINSMIEEKLKTAEDIRLTKEQIEKQKEQAKPKLKEQDDELKGAEK